MGRRNENQRNWAHIWILAYKIAVLSQSWKMTGNISATTITSKGIKPDSHWTIWAKEPAADNPSRGASSRTTQNFGKPNKWGRGKVQGKRSDFYWECIEHTVFFVTYVVESICKKQLGITFFFFLRPICLFWQNRRSLRSAEHQYPS